MSLQVRSYSRKTHLLSSPLRHVSGRSPQPYSRRVGSRSPLRGQQIIVGRTSARPRTLTGKRSLLSRTAATFPLLSQGYRHWWLSSQLTVSNTLEVRHSHSLTQVARRRLRGIVTLWRKWLSRRTERRLRLVLRRRLSRKLESLYPVLFSWPLLETSSVTTSSPVGISRSDIETIRRVENNINGQLNTECYASLNEFYIGLGLPPVAAGELVGWSEPNSLSVEFGSQLDPKGNPVLTIDFLVAPKENYFKIA
nr:MAG TPA: hypothetical protein [Caudoviricetes sp.]